MDKPQAQRRRGSAEGGQALVESAVVLPLYIFLLLGLLQLGLAHQARMMTKYAAYKAVRAGALHSADTAAMTDAALWALTPLLSEGGKGKVEAITPVTTPADYMTKFNKFRLNVMPDAMGLPYVKVDVCGPLSGDLPGGHEEWDFDDPKLSTSTEKGSGGNINKLWAEGKRTKLRVRVTFNYRMPIPFANMILHAMAMGREITPVLHMRNLKAKAAALAYAAQLQDSARYLQAADNGVYVWPIRASYSMRMQSNLYPKNLPSSSACATAGNGRFQ